MNAGMVYSHNCDNSYFVIGVTLEIYFTEYNEDRKKLNRTPCSVRSVDGSREYITIVLIMVHWYIQPLSRAPHKKQSVFCVYALIRIVTAEEEKNI